MSTRDITLTWTDPNIIEKGYKVYRSKTPMDINNMPVAIATLEPNATEYIDVGQTLGDTNYYNVSAWIDGFEVFSEEVVVVVQVLPGEVIVEANADYLWTVPENVNSISAVCVGCGRGSPGSSYPGDGGDLRWINDLLVYPNEVLTIKSGWSGNIPSGIYRDGVELISAYSGGSSNSTPMDGIKIGGGNGGGNGGEWRGGGGAGGYSGDGGAGGYRGVGGNGGGAGGGGTYYSGARWGSSGGGVGLYGQGDSGVGGTDDGFAGGGSGGEDGIKAVAGNYGGGRGGTTRTDGSFGRGAVRIVWGNNRKFPSTNVGETDTF